MAADVNNKNGAMLVALAVGAGLLASLEDGDGAARLPAIAKTSALGYKAHD